VGRVWTPIIVISKKNSTKRVMATARARMEKPMMAEVILSRASLVLALSPPEVSHWNPPQIRKTKIRMEPIIMARRAVEVIKVPMSVMAKLGGWEKVKGEDAGAARTEGTRRNVGIVRIRNRMRRESIGGLIVVVSKMAVNGWVSWVCRVVNNKKPKGV